MEGEENDSFFENELLLEIQDAKRGRDGNEILPKLIDRNERETKQQARDKMRREFQRGYSGFLRELQDSRLTRRSARVMGTRELTPEIVMDGLGGLGKHPVSGRHVMLELNLRDHGLIDCAAIAEFPNLVYVDIANNAIADITHLRAVSAITHLDASQNEISSLNGFAPPLCSKENAWSEGKHAIGSVLIFANFSNNRIANLDGVGAHSCLECLLLSRNSISSMSGLSTLTNLQVLDLSYNKLESISDIVDLNIQELNLKGNMIRELNGLQQMPRLRSLDVSDNQIENISPLSSCTELSYLDISGNLIHAIDDFFVLKPCSKLRRLLSLRNKASEAPSYRRQLIYQLPSLETLDVTFVSAVEKLEAYNYFRDELGDYAIRKEVYGRCFPGETLIDLEDQDKI